MSFASIPEVLAELAAGRFIVLVDDPRRENEGDLIGPAETITNEKLMFMHAEGRGEICVPISGAIANWTWRTSSAIIRNARTTCSRCGSSSSSRSAANNARAPPS